MIILAMIVLTSSKSSSFELDFTIDNSKCLDSIIQNEYRFEKNVAILSDRGYVFKDIHTPVTIFDVDHIQKIKSFVVFETEEILQKFENFDKSAKYIVAARNATRVLDLVQKAGLSKVVVVEGESVHYRSNPQACNHPPVLIKSKNCTYPSYIFEPVKTFTNCRLKVGFVSTPPYVIDIQRPHNPGVHISLMRTLAQVTHLEVVYQDPAIFDDEFLNNGTFYKLGWALEGGEIDVALGHLMMNDTETTPFDFGPLFVQDYITFTGPKPKKLKIYKKLFVVFNIEIWVRIFSGIWVMMLIFYIFGLVENFDRTTLLETVFDVFHVCIGGGLTKLPQWISFRILVTFFFLFSLSMDSIYLGNLSQIFGFSSYDVVVDNINTLKLFHVKCVITWRIERLCKLMYVTRHGAQQKELLHIKNFSDFYVINNTALAKENITLTFTSLLDIYPSESTHLVTNRPMTDYLTLFNTFYVNRNTLFNEAIAFWSQEMVERGLVSKWFEDVRVSNVKTSILPEDEEKVVVLKLAHFEESFTVLIGGYVLGAVGLVLEFGFLGLEKVGVVGKVKGWVVFLVLLLKPPELKKKGK